MNPGCEYIQVMLSDYAEGELADGESRSVEEHLKACQPCAGELTLMRALVSGLHRIPEETAPPAILAALSRRLPVRAAPPRGVLPAWLFSWRFGAAGAVAAFALFLLVSPSRSGKAPELASQAPGIATFASAAPGLVVGGQPASAGSAVAEGAVIETAAGPEGAAAATLAFADGSTVEVGGGARLAAGVEEIRLDTGTLRLSIEKQKVRFRVRTPEALVTVWGTKYRVPHGSVTSVEVQEGRVQVEPVRAGGGSVMLTAGQRAAVDAGRLDVPKAASDPEPVRPEDTRVPLGDDR